MNQTTSVTTFLSIIVAASFHSCLAYGQGMRQEAVTPTGIYAEIDTSNTEIVQEQIGNEYRDLRQRSPLGLAEQIDIPVLLAHGTNDRSVKIQHGQKMYRALEKGGKDVTYVEFEDGDHYLSYEVHRLQFFKAMDAFLQSNLN